MRLKMYKLPNISVTIICRFVNWKSATKMYLKMIVSIRSEKINRRNPDSRLDLRCKTVSWMWGEGCVKRFTTGLKNLEVKLLNEEIFFFFIRCHHKKCPVEYRRHKHSDRYNFINRAPTLLNLWALSSNTDLVLC